MTSDDHKAEDATRESDPHAGAHVCTACGNTARRADARFCAACGTSISDSYLPVDALRASYTVHRKQPIKRRGVRNSNSPPKSSMSSVVSAQNRNSASTTALAFVTYALVPYLGILFCPGAVLMGGVGIFRSYKLPLRGGRRVSYLSVTFGVLILGAQLFLWWVLYKIPEWTNQP